MNIEIQLDPLYGINRKAKFRCLIHNDETRSLAVQWWVFPVDENGVVIEHKLLSKYMKDYVADESTFVNPATGDYVQKANVGTEEQPNWQYPEGSMKEIDYFEWVVTNNPIMYVDMILASGLKAKAAGRFDL